MTTYKLAVIPGPGIGAEVTSEAVRLLESMDLNFDCRYFEIGYEVFLKTGTPVPNDVLAGIRKTQACLFGGYHYSCWCSRLQECHYYFENCVGVVC